MEWPLLSEGGQLDSVGEDAAATAGTVIDAHASTHTKGSWTQLVASSPIACDWIVLCIGMTGNGGSEYLIDLGVGGAGSEQVIVSNVMHAYDLAAGVTQTRMLPVKIAAGQRIAARMQSSVGSRQLYVHAILLKGGLGGVPTLGRCTTYGVNTVDSGGTLLDPGAAANTKGAWVEIASSLTNPIKLLSPMLGPAGDFARSSCRWLIDIGVGGAGSEQVVVPDLPAWYATASEYWPVMDGPPLPVSIAAGQRLAARAACSITTAGDRTVDFALIGVD